MTQKDSVKLVLRLDPETHRVLTRISKESGISINSLIDGTLMDRFREGLVHVGEPVNQDGVVITKAEKKVVWMGTAGKLPSAPDPQDVPEGRVECILDYRRRNAPMGLLATFASNFVSGFKGALDPALAKTREAAKKIEEAPTMGEAMTVYTDHIKDQFKGKKP